MPYNISLQKAFNIKIILSLNFRSIYHQIFSNLRRNNNVCEKEQKYSYELK